MGSRQTWAGQGSAGPNLVSVSLAGEAITSIWRRWHGNYLFVNRHQVTLGYLQLFVSSEIKYKLPLFYL